MRIQLLAGLAGCLLFLPGGSFAEDAASVPEEARWHQWRGPTADGRAPKSARPPVRWDDTTNVAWSVEIPGDGSSTPVVWGDRIFLTSAVRTDRKAEQPPARDERSKTVPPNVYYRFMVWCLDRHSGRLLWKHLATEEVPHEGHHPSHGYAASSPTTDGQRLYVSFGSRGIYALSLDGQRLWKHDPGDMRTRYGWGETVTPVIHNGALVFNWDQEEGSFISCLDAATGAVRWKTDRPNEVTSWNTPLVTEFGSSTLVVANGTHRVRCYDLSDGRELWLCPGQTVNAIPSPVRYDDTVIAMSGYRGSVAVAVPLDSTGDLTDERQLRWKHSGGTPYVPSPVLSGQRLLFTGGNADILTVLDAGTGKRLMPPRRLSGLSSVYASPIVANGHFYFLGRQGVCVVLKDDANLTQVAVNRINDSTDASPVTVEDQLFLRSRTRLYCIQQNP